MPAVGLTPRTGASLIFTAHQFHNRWPLLFIQFFAFFCVLPEKLVKESADEPGFRRQRDKLGLRDRPATVKSDEICQTALPPRRGYLHPLCTRVYKSKALVESSRKLSGEYFLLRARPE